MTADGRQAALTPIRGMLGRLSARTMKAWPGVMTLPAPAAAPAVARATAGIAQGGCYEYHD
jgi:hypothetical protein